MKPSAVPGGTCCSSMRAAAHSCSQFGQEYNAQSRLPRWVSAAASEPQNGHQMSRRSSGSVLGMCSPGFLDKRCAVSESNPRTFANVETRYVRMQASPEDSRISGALPSLCRSLKLPQTHLLLASKKPGPVKPACRVRDRRSAIVLACSNYGCCARIRARYVIVCPGCTFTSSGSVSNPGARISIWCTPTSRFKCWKAPSKSSTTPT